MHDIRDGMDYIEKLVTIIQYALQCDAHSLLKGNSRKIVCTFVETVCSGLINSIARDEILIRVCHQKSMITVVELVE